MNSLKNLPLLLFFYIFSTAYCFSEPFIVDEIAYEIVSEKDKTVKIVANINDFGESLYSGKNLTIPNRIINEDTEYTVTEVGDEAFNKTLNLWLKLPETITKIGKDSFSGTSSVINIILPNSIKEIGDNAFNSSEAILINIYSFIQNPSKVKLGTNTFGQNNNLYVWEEYSSKYNSITGWEVFNNKPVITKIDGFYFTFYNYNGIKCAEILPILKDEFFENIELVIPNSIDFKGEEFLVASGYLITFADEMNKVKKIIFENGYHDHNGNITLGNFPNVLEIEANSSLSIYNFPSLEKITFPNNVFDLYLHNDQTPNLKEIFINGQVNMISSFAPISLSNNKIDVYLASYTPPINNIYNYGFGGFNDNLTFHVPVGCDEVYTESVWNNFNFIGDLEPIKQQVELNFYGDLIDTSNGWSGTGSAYGDNYVEFAMVFSSEMLLPYKGAKITSIDFFSHPLMINEGSENNIEYVYITSEQEKEYKLKLPVSVVRGSKNYFKLPEPLDITGEELIIGIGKRQICGVSWVSDNIDAKCLVRYMGNDYSWDEVGKWMLVDYKAFPISITIEGDNLPNDMVILRTEDNNRNLNPSQSYKVVSKGSYCNWINVIKETEISYQRKKIDDLEISSPLYGNFSFYNEPEVFETKQSLSPLSTNSDYGTTSFGNISVTVQNRNLEPTKSFRITGEINNEIVYDNIFYKTLLTNQTAQVLVQVPVKDNSGINHRIKINVEEVNGKKDEIPANSSKELTFMSQDGILTYPRKIVVEEQTATWCQWCPEGIVAIEYLKEKFPDNFIPISVHDSDEMSPDSTYDPFFGILSSVPSCIINRVPEYGFDVNKTHIEDLIHVEKDNASAMIVIKASFADTECTSLNIDTESKFGYDSNNNDVKITFVITEDIVGPYIQSNIYSGTDELEGWGDLGFDVLMHFNDVARSIYSYNGIPGSVPIIVEADKVYNKQFQILLPFNIDNPANISVIALLIDGITGEIINADKVTPSSYDANIDELKNSKLQFKVKDGSIITNDSLDEIHVFTIDGKKLNNKNLSSGIYIVKAIRNSITYTNKIVLK